MSLDYEASMAAAEEKLAQDEVFEEPEKVKESISFDFSFLKAPTGPGGIEDYKTHVLNPSGSAGVAQVLRGVTGLAGDLNLAVLDILFGTFRILQERKPETAEGGGVNVSDLYR